ncbi:MAG: hypothetical protein JNJ71_20540 [Rubrivivax sp.]|nr:hypothetical protein [Rubrivivax sp.]
MTPDGSGGIQLYAYWKTLDTTRALALARQMQADLRQTLPGLQAQLLQRADAGHEPDVTPPPSQGAPAAEDGSAKPGHPTTLMEIYRLPGAGLTKAEQALIDAMAAERLATVIVSARQVERFVSLPPAGAPTRPWPSA